jgi:hypothetical protein
MAEKKTKEQLKAEADARRAASKEKQEAHAKLLAERRAANKQKTLDTMAARKEERESKATAAAAAAAAQKEARLKAAEATKAEHQARLASAKEARAAAKIAARGAKAAPAAAVPAAPATPVKPAKRGAAAAAAAVAAPVAATPAAKKPAKPEPIGIAIGMVLPAAVERELNRAIKTATLSIREQVNGSLKLPDGGDKREQTRLEAVRKRLISSFEGLIALVCDRIAASPVQSASLSLDPATGRAQFAPYAVEIGNPLRGRIASNSKDLLAALGEEATRKAFPALTSPFMLQFFGDMETGQVLDGSLIMTYHPEQAAETVIAYKVTLGAASKKVKGPALKLEFSHNLSASTAAGTVHFGFPIILPAEPAKS